MKKSLLVMPLLVIGMVTLAPSASAITVYPLKLNVEKPVLGKSKKKTVEKGNGQIATPLQKKIQPVVQEYVVISGDTLSKIAETHQTTIQRLWQKNTQLSSPDLLNVGDKLVIPSATETLADRPIAAPAAVNISRPVIPGNGYDYGNCTFYVKTRRPDIGNFWGNADQWGYSARAAGYEVNNTPSVGSIGVAVNYMHVVYIEAVNGDGTVSLSEENYKGLGIISTRTAPVSEFVYIH